MPREAIPTFVTPANARMFVQHPRHVPGAYRITRPGYGRWEWERDGVLYRPRLVHEAAPPPPRSEWPAIIARKNVEKSWLKDIFLAVTGNPLCQNQGSEGTCWLHGTCRAMNAAIILAKNNAPIKLAPNSLGPVFNWNVAGGGDPGEALQALVTHGAARDELCQPPLAGSHRQWTSGWEEDCKNHKIIAGHLIDGLNGSSFDNGAGFCFSNIPSSAGHNYWNHEIMGPVRVLDAQQMPGSWVDAYAAAGGFDLVPREFIMDSRYLGAGRFMLEEWNNWGHDTEFVAMTESHAPDIDLTGVTCTLLTT